MLKCEVIKARFNLVLPRCVLCGVGVSVCVQLGFRCARRCPTYCTGGDHHKAQTGGAIWPSLRPSPGDWEVEAGGEVVVWGPSMMDVSWKWTGHSHNGRTPLWSPIQRKGMGEPPITHCIQTNKYTLTSHL